MNNDVQELLVQFLLQDNTRDRKRKIIFWYDEKQEYSEDIDDIVLSDTEIIKYDNNSFWIRYHIEKEIPDKNVLIYLPFAKKKGLDNDLLDLGNAFDPTVYGEVTEAINKLKDSAELYGEAISRLHNADAQLELSDYLKTNDINSKETFDNYINGI